MNFWSTSFYVLSNNSQRIPQTTSVLKRNDFWSPSEAIGWRVIKHLYDNGQEMHIFQIRVEQHENLIL